MRTEKRILITMLLWALFLILLMIGPGMEWITENHDTLIKQAKLSCICGALSVTMVASKVVLFE